MPTHNKPLREGDGREQHDSAEDHQNDGADGVEPEPDRDRNDPAPCEASAPRTGAIYILRRRDHDWAGALLFT